MAPDERPPKLIRASDVARRLNYSTWTIKKWARAGKLPGAVFLARHVRFDAAQIEEFIQTGGERPAVEQSQPPFSLRRHGGGVHAGSGPVPSRSGAPLAAEDSITTRRDHPRADACEHRWTLDDRNVSDAHPHSMDMRKLTRKYDRLNPDRPKPITTS
jgi:excisionase family DNA binding protein